MPFLTLGSEGTAYVALGIGSLFNHDGRSPNLEIWLDESSLKIDFIAKREVKDNI